MKGLSNNVYSPSFKYVVENKSMKTMRVANSWKDIMYSLIFFGILK